MSRRKPKPTAKHTPTNRHSERTAAMNNKTQTMTYDEVNAILDACCFGDTLTIVRTNGGDLTATVSGPVLCAPGDSRAVGIDMLDGGPYVVREESGDVWGQFLRVEVEKGEPR